MRGYLMGTGFLFRMIIRKFWNLMVAEFAHIVNAINTTELYTLKWYMINFVKI